MNTNMRISNFIVMNDCNQKAVDRSSSFVMFFASQIKSQILAGLLIIAGFLMPTFGNSQDPCAGGMKCNSFVNLSLDESCSSTVTAAMLLKEMPFSESDYIVRIYNDLGEEITNVLDIDDVDKSYEAKVILPACNNNSCWTDLTVEYKLPPEIVCPGDLTLSCGALDILGLPPATSSCAGLAFEVTLHDEAKERLDCDPLYTHRVIRTYRATDIRGNFVECSHEILLERVDLSAIMYPESRIGNDAISCSDEGFIFDENGFPLPWLNSNLTGSGSTSGVPFVCDPDLTNGVFCPLTGSGAPLIPIGGATDIDEDGNVVIIEGQANQFCNSAIFYTDVEQFSDDCKKTIMRSWEIREWWCSGENTVGSIQMIEVVDDEAPTFTCPDNFTVTTNDDCAGSVVLDSIVAVDNCMNGIIVSIDYPNGLLKANGGVAELDTGINMIKYIVADGCYNIDSCYMHVTVLDETEPVAICEQNTAISISPNGMTEVFAEVFDDGSWDECSPVKFEVRRMDSLCVASDTLFGKSITFCCSDVVDPDLMVVFRAYDNAGNYNDCMVNVDVQDKVPAIMSCPEDQFIDCREPYDIENLSLLFGAPDITDNCANTQIVNEFVDTDSIDQCGLGKIIRRFELMDELGNFALKTCKQTIYINNETPFIQDSITWPGDVTLPEGCSADDAHPEDLLLIAEFADDAYPIINGDRSCSLIGWDWDDRVIQSTGTAGECVVIERTWTVINWCGAISGTFETFVIPTPQVIIVRSTKKPDLEPAEDSIVIESINIDCESGLIRIERTATDECSPDDLIWSYRIKDSADTIIAVGDTNVLVDTLTNGLYTIEWEVKNQCHFKVEDTQTVEVINLKAPTPVCRYGMNITLTFDNTGGIIDETAEIWASDLDAGSYHPCGNPIQISLSADSVLLNRTFTCADIGDIELPLWVRDTITGVQDFCTSLITITDDGECPDMNRVDVQGEIYTENLEQVEGVMVSLEGGDIQDMTEGDGHYAFNDMPIGGSYMVVPNKDTDFLNGVSTLDLVMIQRHILGLQKFDSPYKMIAADINGNEEISAIDLIQLRKLVLGIESGFPDNTSWRFVDADYKFVDNSNPWVYDVKEDYEIFNLTQNMNIDFIGVKIGDVNSSVIANATSGSIDSRSTRWGLEFSAEKVKSDVKDVKTIAFTSSNYERVTGFQGTFEFNADKVQVLDISGKALDLNDDNFNLNNVDQGWFTMSYFDLQESDIDTDEVLFMISYIEKESYVSDVPFVMTSTQTRAEAYRGLNEIVDLKIADQHVEEVAIVGAHPNPWSDNTNIEFFVPQDGQVNWEFFDVNGRRLHQINDFYSKGNHRINLRRSELNVSGVIYVRMTSAHSQAEFKMMVIN